ncbi:hypothetical protein [Ramlibacter sp.]|uniref:hypothetical protein n=1 Tax=Ramlibacter sp. TaxID=1917967 RepID=UPI002FC8AA3A
MNHSAIAIALSGLLLSTVAFAQSRGEVDYDEQCRRAAPQGTPAEQAATRQRCIEEARQAAKTGKPGEQPQTSATRGTASKAERQAARKERRAAGAEVARQAKQDPKQPDQK